MDGGKQKILAVDDDQNWLQVIKASLESSGYEAILAPNGKEGLEKALQLKPDLILLDLKMAEMDGYEMLKRLRADENGKEMKVIILTNVETGPSITECLNYNVAGYVTKSDADLEDLGNMIKTII